MQDILRLVMQYLAGIWRHRWYAIAVALIACPIGWFYTASLPDEYVAQARVFVDTDSVLTPLLNGMAIQTGDSRRVTMMTNVLFSRDNMEKLARMTDLDLRAKTPQQTDDLIKDLKDRVMLARQGDNIYTISFEDRAPDLAKRVVQSMLTIFVESNLGSSRQDQDSAQRFLQRELKDYERRLIEGERKMKEFKMRNMDILSDRGSYYTRLQAARSSLKRAEDGVRAAIRRRDMLTDQIAIAEEQGADSAEYEQYIAGELDKYLAEQDQRIRDMQKQLDDMLLRYTDVHPDIIAMKGALERLKAQREQDKKAFIAKQDRGAVIKSLSANPVYQQLRMRLADAESEISAQQAQVENLKGEIEKYQASVDQVLQVETEQQQLNRDYAMLKTNHGQLLERIEKARLTREVDTSVDTVKFRTLDPPKVPAEPSNPNRVLLASLVFAGASAAGIGLALLLSMIRPVFGDRRQLSEVTGLQVLGSLDMVWTLAERRKRRSVNVAFGIASAVLFGAFAAVLVLFYLRIDILSKLPL
jgi:polysaccharide chain length determinant protein (PEP-CTERM system associated)